jgi:hypothetical protein
MIVQFLVLANRTNSVKLFNRLILVLFTHKSFVGRVGYSTSASFTFEPTVLLFFYFGKLSAKGS